MTEYEKGSMGFLLYKRIYKNGIPTKPVLIESDAPIFSLMASCVSLTIDLLRSEVGRIALADQALAINQFYIDETNYGNIKEDPKRARNWVDQTLLPAIMDSFPPMFIDDGWIDDNQPAATMTHSGPAAQHAYAKAISIHLNPNFISELEMATTTEEKHTVRELMFAYMCILAHEIGGHVLVAYLTERRDHTPDTMPRAGSNARVWWPNPESGKAFEERLFGIPVWMSPKLSRLGMRCPGIILTFAHQIHGHEIEGGTRDFLRRPTEKTIKKYLERGENPPWRPGCCLDIAS